MGTVAFQKVLLLSRLDFDVLRFGCANFGPSLLFSS